MDLENLKEFLRQVETLPCKVPEAKLLEDHLQEVEEFQEEAREELQRATRQAEQRETLPSSLLSLLLARGEELGIEVPELDLLRVAVRQSQWVVETEAKLRLEVLSMEGLRRLLRQAAAMEPGRLVEVASRRVRELLTAAQDWENEAKAAVKQRPPHPASYLENLLAKARHISVQLPSRSLLEEGLGRAAEWRRQAQLLQDNDSHPHYDHLKSLLASGRPIAVKLDLLAQLESRHAAAKGWVDRAGRTFIKKNSVVSLLEVLLPRTRAQFFQRFSQSGKSGKKKAESVAAVVGELEVGRSPLSDLGGDRLKEMEKIHSMEDEEVQWMKQLRNENLEKMERDETRKNGSYPPVLYCFCRKPESGYMLQCELCNEWYHATCLHIPKGKRAPGRDIGKDSRFLCALCLRTRRPRLDAIVSLLISLQKVPVAISEGTALHCLAERAIQWQKRARQEIQNCNTILEAAKQQMRRVEEVKAHIAKWKAEMQLTAEERERPSSIEAQLASSAGELTRTVCWRGETAQ
jgi:histone demethylase JARID1